MSTLADLPDPLLQQALSYLAQEDVAWLLTCSAVSHRWRALTTLVLQTDTQRLAPKTHVTATAMVWMGTCPHLTCIDSLHVSGATCAVGLRFLTTSQLGRVRLGQLHTLSIDSCVQLRDDSLDQTLQHCGALRTLELTQCSRLTDTALTHIARHCPSLTALTLKDIHSLYDDAVCRLLSVTTDLQRLCLDGALHLTSAVLVAVGKNCPGLRQLSVTRCVRLRNHGLSALAGACRQLEHLSLAQCHALSEIGCLAACPLQRLDLRGTTKVDVAQFRVLLAGPCARHLTHVTLDGCGAVTGSEGPNMLLKLGRACPQIQELRFQFVPGLNDAHLTTLAATCTALTTLAMPWHPQVEGPGLQTVLAANRQLTSLDVEGCYALGGGLLAAINEHTPLLNKLNIRMCIGLRDAMHEWLYGLASESRPVRRPLSVYMSGVLLDNTLPAQVSRALREVDSPVSLHY